jgi:hypothetical protein
MPNERQSGSLRFPIAKARAPLGRPNCFVCHAASRAKNRRWWWHGTERKRRNWKRIARHAGPGRTNVSISAGGTWHAT